MLSRLASLVARPLASSPLALNPSPLAGAWRGLAWKTSGRPTREEIMRGTRAGWSIRRQIVPDRVRIPGASWKLRIGDVVEVIGGKNDSVGKQGKIIQLRPIENRVLVDGLNMQATRTKAKAGEAVTAANKSRLGKKEGPIHYSNVMLVDPVSKKPTRISMRTTASGKSVRVAVKSNAIIPFPERVLPKSSKANGPQDTPTSDVHGVTYERYHDFMTKFPFSGSRGHAQSARAPVG